MMHHGQDLLWPHHCFIPTDVQNPDHFRKTNKYSLPKYQKFCGPKIQNIWGTGNEQLYVDRKWLMSGGPEMAKIPRGPDKEHAQ